MKQIVAIVDFSEMMNEVIREATELARGIKTELVLLYIKPPKSTLVVWNVSFKRNDMEHEKIVKAERKKIQAIADKLTRQGLVVSQATANGTQIESLIDVLHVLASDYVVIGAHTRSWIDDKIRGSHWIKLIRESNTPIIIVPEKIKRHERFSEEELANVCQKMRKKNVTKKKYLK